MKGAMLYVNAGKGHYTPAVALAESFNNAGHNAIAEDLFTVVGAPFWEWFCKYDWRFLLHHPHLEGLSHRITDNRLSFYLIRWQGLSKKHLSNLYNWYIKHKPDFIVFNKDGSTEVIDVKGFKTKEYIAKKKVFEDKYNLKIIEI